MKPNNNHHITKDANVFTKKNIPQHFLRMHQEQQVNDVANFHHFNTLHIYDFDGTLFNTPEPTHGHDEYQQKTGRPFPVGYWWDRHESLDANVFHISEGPAYQDFWKSTKKQQQQPQPQQEDEEDKEEDEQDKICTLMMTGRSFRLRASVLRIMNRHGMRPLFSIFKPLNYRNSTLSYKQEALKQLIALFPNVKRICLWEDRIEHAKQFRLMQLRNEVLGLSVQMTVHHVTPATTTYDAATSASAAATGPLVSIVKHCSKLVKRTTTTTTRKTRVTTIGNQERTSVEKRESKRPRNVCNLTELGHDDDEQEQQDFNMQKRRKRRGGGGRNYY